MKNNLLTKEEAMFINEHIRSISDCLMNSCNKDQKKITKQIFYNDMYKGLETDTKRILELIDLFNKLDLQNIPLEIKEKNCRIIEVCSLLLEGIESLMGFMQTHDISDIEKSNRLTDESSEILKSI